PAIAISLRNRNEIATPTGPRKIAFSKNSHRNRVLSPLPLRERKGPALREGEGWASYEMSAASPPSAPTPRTGQTPGAAHAAPNGRGRGRPRSTGRATAQSPPSAATRRAA